MQVAALYSVLALELHEKKRPELLQETANEVFRYLRDGRLQIKATKSFPLQDAGKAHEWVESRKSTGKVILTVQSSS